MDDVAGDSGGGDSDRGVLEAVCWAVRYEGLARGAVWEVDRISG